MSTDRLEAAKKKFSRLLKEIFQFDCADLDFGIYRILALRRHELEDFLDKDLLPQVEELLAGAAGDRQAVVDELAKLEDNLRAAGITDFSTSPKWQELKGRLASQPHVAGLAREVFSDLTTFFSRYYDEGDFLALPRYKGDTYAIPYDGTEVKLHWANADQYYIKTTEQHSDYRAELVAAPGLSKPVLLFKLAAAESDRDNNKSSDKRRYVLRAEDPVAVDDDSETLTAWFEYKVVNDSGRQPSQKSLCEEAEGTILDEVPASWKTTLTRPAAQNDAYTQLGYQLYRYTKRNTSDYFIHKDLGGFLRRELDFFIKNEVLFLDDLEGRSTSDIEAALRKVRALRGVGGKIIDWLAQLEDLQKRLYLKKKFVLRTEWTVSTDLLPTGVAEEIHASAAHQAWHTEVLGELKKKSQVRLPGAGGHTLIDTSSMSTKARDELLATFDDIESELTGVLVSSENLQALGLLRRRLSKEVDCIYVDPPYNTSENTFVYKNEYKHSSWLAMIADRVVAALPMLHPSGVFQIAIDDTETAYLRAVLDDVFGSDNRLATLAVEVNPAGQNLKPNAPALSHDYCHVYSLDAEKSQMLLRSLTPDEEKAYKHTDDEGPFLWDNLRRRGGNSRPKDRPKQWFPLYVSLDDHKVSTTPFDGSSEVWPIDPKGIQRIWRVNKAGAERGIRTGDISVIEVKGAPRVVKKTRMPEGKKPKTLWSDSKYSATSHGTKLLISILGEQSFSYPKSIHLVKDCIGFWCDESATILDYFAGSGTTAHAVLRLNREDGGQRRFVAVEMGTYFDAVLVPRVLRSMYSEKWDRGRCVAPDVMTGIVKRIYLESYDDTLENVALQRDSKLGELFKNNNALREDYTLRYMLDLESRGSLLNLEKFRKPWDYTIKVRKDGVVHDSPVDLVETFNYLLGLRVQRYDCFGQDGLLFVTGMDPDGQRVIVVWRDCDLWPNEDLEKKCKQAFEGFRPDEFDVVYVNGDHHLPIIRTGEERWKVNLTEETFHALMFDTSDVE